MSNTPSDAEIRGLAAEGNGVYQDDETAVWEITDPSLIKFARAVLAKWGTPQPADCTRSHPHEDMSGYCLLRTEIARLANENARLKAGQPVVREQLTDEQIAEMMRETWGCASIAPRHAKDFARAIEAEVRKQDDALIQQMLVSMCWAARVMAISEDEAPGYFAAITAARARLGEKT